MGGSPAGYAKGEDALQALQQAVPDFARYLLGNSIEIVAARDWYLQDGTFRVSQESNCRLE